MTTRRTSPVVSRSCCRNWKSWKRPVARSVAVEMASLMEEDAVLLDHLVAAHGAQKTDHGTPHSAHSRSAVMPHAGQMTLQRWRKKDVCTVARSRHFHTHHLSHATLSHTHTHTYIRTYVRTYVHTYIHTYIRICILSFHILSHTVFHHLLCLSFLPRPR